MLPSAAPLRLVADCASVERTAVLPGALFGRIPADAAADEMFEAAARIRPHYHALLEELGRLRERAPHANAAPGHNILFAVSVG